MKKIHFHILFCISFLLILYYNLLNIKFESTDLLYVSHIHNNEVIFKILLQDNRDNIHINKKLHTSYFHTILKSKDREIINNPYFDNLYYVDFNKCRYLYVRVNLVKFYEMASSGDVIIKNLDATNLPDTFYFNEIEFFDREIFRPLFKIYLINAIKLHNINLNYYYIFYIFFIWILAVEYQHRNYIIGSLIVMTLFFRSLNLFVLSILYLCFLAVFTINITKHFIKKDKRLD